LAASVTFYCSKFTTEAFPGYRETWNACSLICDFWLNHAYFAQKSIVAMPF